jgi:cation:H+ antiporter
MIFVWIKFFLCAAIIYFAGSKLTRYGDAIAHKTGLSRAWVGIVLLALVTSLPELANGISAVTLVSIPDLAMGDLLGACMINMFSLAMLDLLWGILGRGSVFMVTDRSNLLSSVFGVGLLLTVSASLALSRLVFDFTLFGISIYSFIIVGIYFLALKVLGRHMAEETPGADGDKYAQVSNLRVYSMFLAAALAVIGAGIWLPFIGVEIIAVMGWGKAFVAVLFIALVTTLPELTVSFTALRLGQKGMAIGNLVGSNIFNVAMIFLIDIFNQPASLISQVSFNMIYAALSGALLVGIAYFTLKRKIINHVPSAVIVLAYLLSIYLLFRSGVLS